MAGGGAPGGLPLIVRFSWSQARSLPVSLPLRAGTLVLVNFFIRSPCAIFPKRFFLLVHLLLLLV
jgi:hypothetical protein